jgi:hypothetical protein
LFSQRRYGAGYFVPGHERIFGHTPIVIEDGEIGMTNAAMTDLDFDFFGPEWTGIETEGF